MKLQTCLSGVFILLMTATFINAQTEKPIVSPTKGAPVRLLNKSKSVAPAFNLTSLDSKKFELSSLRGKVVVLNFWFTGCPPCLTEMPKLNELVENFKNDGVVFIAPTWDGETVLQTFLKDHPFKYNIAANAGDLIIDTYGDGTGNVAMPTHIVIDAEGNIDTKIVGGLITIDGNTKGLDELTDTITRLVKKPSIMETSDDFDKKFREARDSIDKEEWAKAADKFKELIAKYPDNKSTDAALYWLAFSYKKQKNYREANAVLDRLTREFSDSSWADDARVMKMEIMPSLGGFGTIGVSSVFAPNASIKTGVTSIASASEYQTALGNLLSTDSKIPLEREDEIKLAAFQSLLSADTKRAIEILGDIIKPDSKASESLKRYVLRAFRNSYRTSPQLTQQLRETLVDNLQKQPNSKVGTEIIYTLGSINDEQSISYLAKLYASENNAETKKAIINIFGSNSQSYFYTFNTDSTGFMNSSSNSNSARKMELDSLLEIIRSEKNTELRQLAFSKMLRFGNLTANPQFVSTISQLYDAETDEDFKLSIIRTLREIKQNQASKKLLDIAKTEKSDKLKLEAIRSLRTSRDPEVLKFLEQLIK